VKSGAQPLDLLEVEKELTGRSDDLARRRQELLSVRSEALLYSARERAWFDALGLSHNVVLVLPTGDRPPACAAGSRAPMSLRGSSGTSDFNAETRVVWTT
jgi:hypothetical protein